MTEVNSIEEKVIGAVFHQGQEFKRLATLLGWHRQDLKLIVIDLKERGLVSLTRGDNPVVRATHEGREVCLMGTT